MTKISTSLHTPLDVLLDGAKGYGRRATSANEATPLGGRRKRAFDLLVAATALALLWPLMLVIAALIRLSSGPHVLFAQPRVGFGGRTFRCLKFRTMAPDADRLLAEHLASDPEAAAEWNRARKLRRDPRVTRLGIVLRRTSLDELPQFINVSRGEMSCIGPRPIVTEELVRYGDAAKEYLSARPGISGAWQVSGRSSTTYAERVAIDRSYVRNWSFGRDLLILLLTGLAVLAFDDAA
jgi:exopolysaccharide production protein ExoY